MARPVSAQTQREIELIGLPLQSSMELRGAITKLVTRLRRELVLVADQREAGRYRGDMTRRRKALEKGEDRGPILTEAEWLMEGRGPKEDNEPGDLIDTFDYSYAVAQDRARHMLDYASQEGLMLLDGVAGPDWFAVDWQIRWNQRNNHGDQRILMSIGTSKLDTRQHGITPTMKFQMVTVQEYQQWLELMGIEP